MFQVIQKSKTDAKVRTWKNDLYKRIWEEVYKDINKKIEDFIGKPCYND